MVVKRWIPWAMAAGRMLLGPILILASRSGWSGLALAGLVVSALLSDIFDGVLARRWNCDTAAVRLFDSMADTVFYLCAALALRIEQPQLWRDNAVLLSCLLSLEAFRFLLDFARFGKPASYHSWLAKSWGLVLAVAVIATFASRSASPLLPLALWFGILTDFEGLTMSLILPVWRRDVKTIAAARRIREQIVSHSPSRRTMTQQMRWRGTAIVAVISFFSASIICAQTSKAGTLQDRVRAGKILSEETQARGYWVDPTTGLMWAAKDNGKDLRWKQAVKYCRNLRLNGHTDWRLPSLQELEAIADPSAVSPGLAGHDKTRPFFWNVKGGLFVTGDEWSSTPVMGDRGKPLFAWYFDFINLRAGDDDGNMGFWDSYDKRALCVRQS